MKSDKGQQDQRKHNNPDYSSPDTKGCLVCAPNSQERRKPLCDTSVFDGKESWRCALPRHHEGDCSPVKPQNASAASLNLAPDPFDDPVSSTPEPPAGTPPANQLPQPPTNFNQKELAAIKTMAEESQVSESKLLQLAVRTRQLIQSGKYELCEINPEPKLAPSSPAAPAGEREQLAKWFFENHPNNEPGVDYAKWPNDAARQPYCQWAYACADRFMSWQAARASAPTQAEATDLTAVHCPMCDSGLILSLDEVKVVADLANRQGISPSKVWHDALKVYQLHVLGEPNVGMIAAPAPSPAEPPARAQAERIYDRIFDPINGPLVAMEAQAFDHMLDIAKDANIVSVIEGELSAAAPPRRGEREEK